MTERLLGWLVRVASLAAIDATRFVKRTLGGGRAGAKAEDEDPSADERR